MNKLYIVLSTFVGIVLGSAFVEVNGPEANAKGKNATPWCVGFTIAYDGDNYLARGCVETEAFCMHVRSIADKYKDAIGITSISPCVEK